MRHAGEAKAAGAIGVDQAPARDEALGARRRGHPLTFSGVGAGALRASGSGSLSKTSARTPR